MQNQNNNEGFIVEVISIGHYSKVTAIDEKTGEEATCIGAANQTSIELLKSMAIKKLKNKLNKLPK